MKNRSRFPLEKNIVNDILSALDGHGIIFKRKIHGDPYQTNGIPDIIAVEPTTGRFVGLEVKRPEIGKATLLQHKALNEINESGGYATVITSVSDAIKAMQRAALGHSVKLVAATAKYGVRMDALGDGQTVLCKLDRGDGTKAWLVEILFKKDGDSR